ncbi:hypothetical protein FB451DRAFT_1179569 [Mycena latifolia]|nr:hypothetical protein FB451DRAFT_1179569 [Mycena latifolia]
MRSPRGRVAAASGALPEPRSAYIAEAVAIGARARVPRAESRAARALRLWERVHLAWVRVPGSTPALRAARLLHVPAGASSRGALAWSRCAHSARSSWCARGSALRVAEHSEDRITMCVRVGQSMSSARLAGSKGMEGKGGVRGIRKVASGSGDDEEIK